MSGSVILSFHEVNPSTFMKKLSRGSANVGGTKPTTKLTVILLRTYLVLLSSILSTRFLKAPIIVTSVTEIVMTDIVGKSSIKAL